MAFSHGSTIVCVRYQKDFTNAYSHGFFWLWKSATKEDRETFRNGLNYLMRDSNVRHSVIGEPAKTDRDVVDSTYDFGAIVTFDNLTEHNLYQIGQHHEDFLQTCQHLWNRVQVFDIEN